jgi:predicted permease
MSIEYALTAFFLPIFKAVLVIFLVGLVSTILIRKNIISQKDIQSLSHITVILLLPCLIFAKIVQYFHPSEFDFWYVLPIIAITMIVLGMGLYALLSLRNKKGRRAMMVVSGFMNANYMVLPIGALAFSEQFNTFAAYTFLFVLGVNPSLWSFGKFMLTAGDNAKFEWKSLLTLPFAASIVAILLVLSNTNQYIPKVVLNTIDFIGQAAIPVVTIVLGATLGSIPMRKNINWIPTLKVSFVKLLLIPVIVIGVLYYIPISRDYPLLADLLVLQASVAPATTIIIQVRKYGGDTNLVGTTMLVNYILCLLTVPAWMMVWNVLVS